MLEMERRLISPLGFVSDPDELYPSGTADVRAAPNYRGKPTKIDLSKDTFFSNLETLGTGKLVYDEEAGEYLVETINTLTGEPNRTDVDHMIGQNTGLQQRIADGRYDSHLEALNQAKNKVFDTARDIITLKAQNNSKKSWRQRVMPFRPLKGERWMSDARKDTRPGAWYKSNPALPASALTAHRDNLRLVVGQDSTIQTGLLGVAHQMPRIYIQNADGRETKASISLNEALNTFNSRELFNAWLETTFSNEEVQNWNTWVAAGFLDEYVAGVGTFATRRNILQPMREEELKATDKGTTAIQKGMMRPY
jgi:hypothetical protein